MVLPPARYGAVAREYRAAEAGRACLDYSALSRTRVSDGISNVTGVRSRLEWYQRMTVYRSGELEGRVFGVNRAARPPAPPVGPRYTEGLTPASARRIRRAIIARDRAGPCQWVMLTLTCQAEISDEQMRADFNRFTAWARKYLRGRWAFYVWVAELQARGVLHYHLLLPNRIPQGLFRRLRGLWADRYGMGAGSVHIRPMRSAGGAAKYIGKMASYVSKSARGQCQAYRVGLDGEGMLTFQRWRVGRDGSPYSRVLFRGRGCALSASAAYFAGHTVRFEAPLGAFRGLGDWPNGSFYLESVAKAERLLEMLLESGP